MMRPAVRIRRVGALALALVMPGCAVVPAIGSRAPRLPATPPPLIGGYTDATGVIHAHTTYSDGTAAFDEVAWIAAGQGLDFLIVTDHNTLGPVRDGRPGWYGPTLVLAGTELSTAAGHLLALNVREEIPREGRSAQAVIDAVNAQGGLAFAAHPFGKRPWTDWSVRGLLGMEIYNAFDDFISESRWSLPIWMLLYPREPFLRAMLDRPRRNLEHWDAMRAAGAPLVGIGVPDAHGPRALGVSLAPYGVMFRLVRTHLLVAPGPLTKEAIYDALLAGRAYVAFELDASAEGAAFTAEQDGRVAAVMGETMPYSADVTLLASVPEAARITILRDGRPVLRTTGRRAELSPPGPGAYRMEAERRGEPWVYSNPISLEGAP
ncbi:MAG TPA: CehA/McbA family metallohydrolase [bacterium]